MKRLQHLSAIMESVPVLWDGDYRVVDAMVGGVLGVTGMRNSHYNGKL